MKKILVLLVLIFSIFGFAQQIEADEASNEIYLHYYRFGGDYDNWNVWGWQNMPTSEEGAQFDFVTDETSAEYNFGGVVAIIDIDDTFPGITKMGLIIRKGAWLEKDIASDRFIEIPANSSNGELHYYFVEGDAAIGTSLDDIDGPVKSPKFKYAYFTNMNTITFEATETIPSANITVYADGIPESIESIVIDDTEGTIVLTNDLSFAHKYTIEATFSSDSSVNELQIGFDGIYDSEAFETAYAYDGDLGAFIDGSNTIFRVWAPISENVTLNLYSTGTSLADGGTDTPSETIAMTASEKGTFEYIADSNLHGTYYTFSVTNGGVTNEVVDPYAKGVGVNGYRGLVVDFSQTNPEGFSYNDRPDIMVNNTDAIIYELHVRDLTSSTTWNGTEANRGRFLGLIEEGTTYEGATTGFDHIVELGVTHVQLLPFFDFGMVDETRLDEEGYNLFNWGYMPLNFNAIQGSYSSDPYDGLTRITELKQVVMAYSEADIRVNMDVVYNHTGQSADSNFSLIVPGYYYRMNNNGSFSNGSGTGNETASERAMMRKFMVDSLLFWATEYNLSGFRFDLMALHDTETMEIIAAELHEIDPTIMVYGEPWTGGTSPLADSLKAGKTNLAEIEGVGAFNDATRDGIKGSVFAREQGGWIQGDLSLINAVKYGIVGGISHPSVLYTAWHKDPNKTINYVACHDNNTLYDKLYLTLEEDDELDLILPLAKQSYGIIFTSQGISFIHAGDEFLRSKPSESGTGFDHNSYESPDSVNQIDWSLKTSADGADMFAYVKELIELRNTHESFRMSTSQDILDNLSFLYEDEEGIIAYQISNGASNDAYGEILVIQNSNTKNTKLKLPTGGGWVLITNNEIAGDTEIETFKGGEKISVEEHSTYILYQDTTIEDYNPLPTIIISIVGGLAVLSAGAFIVFTQLKKK
ncbi:MAG: type I pullulanase [Tenericutes bacterium]|nr:type I pullulanase [Mycoplasmatota bacterium]